MKILNHFVSIAKVPHPDKPGVKVYAWRVKVLNPQEMSQSILAGYSTTMNGATNDASIVLYDEVKKGNLL